MLARNTGSLESRPPRPPKLKFYVQKVLIREKKVVTIKQIGTLHNNLFPREKTTKKMEK